ncbi:hypothetical protein OROMI_003536 [Orobanche minor]
MQRVVDNLLAITKEWEMTLAAKLYGTFEVIDHVGVTAYRLRLPSQYGLQPVFYILQLKATIGNHALQSELPDTLMIDESEFELKRILRDHKVWGDDRVRQLLVE